MKIVNVKTNKIIRSLVITMLVGFIMGILFISVLSDGNKDIIKNNINDYFNNIFAGKFTYIKSFFSVCGSNLTLVLFIWLMGISLLGGVIGIFYLLYKSFLVGFSFASIVYTFKLKGLLIGMIYIFPEVLYLLLYFFLIFYSSSFSNILIRYLFKRYEFNKSSVLKRYVKVLFFVVGLVVVNSLVLVFLIPNLLKMFNF